MKKSIVSLTKKKPHDKFCPDGSVRLKITQDQFLTIALMFHQILYNTEAPIQEPTTRAFLMDLFTKRLNKIAYTKSMLKLTKIQYLVFSNSMQMFIENNYMNCTENTHLMEFITINRI